MSIIVRLVVNALALWVATQLVPGITYTGDGVSLLGVALVFGVLNVILKPVLVILTLPFLIVTLGLFTLVLNAVMLWLTSAASSSLGLGFHVDGFVAAFLGALVVSVVSFAMSLFVSSDESKKDKRK